MQLLPVEVLYRITAYLDTRDQRAVFRTCKGMYAKWFLQREENVDDDFLQWALRWLAERPKNMFDSRASGVTAYYVQSISMQGLDYRVDLPQARTGLDWCDLQEWMAVVSYRGHAFPAYHLRCHPVCSSGFLFRPDNPPSPNIHYDPPPHICNQVCGKEQLLRRMTDMPPVQCAVLHLMTLRSLPWVLLQQAAQVAFDLLCSGTWLRGQIILYLLCRQERSHIIIDLNFDGTWAVDDRKSRHAPTLLDFQHMPTAVDQVKAFYYSPSAERFVDESEHDDCECRAAVDWDEASKLFVYNQNVDAAR